MTLSYNMERASFQNKFKMRVMLKKTDQFNELPRKIPHVTFTSSVA